MAAAQRWPDYDTIKFIDLYKSLPYLWDPTSKLYKNKSARRSGYTKIANEMNMTNFSTTDVRNKIKNLRSTYNQELRKVKMSDKGYTPHLVWFNHFEAIMNEQRKQNRSPQSQSNTMEHEDSIPYNIQQAPRRNSNQEARPKLDRWIQEAPEDDTVNNLRENSSVYENEDEFQSFGNNVAAQLRMLPLPNALRMQIKIQSILAEERISCHGSEEVQDILPVIKVETIDENCFLFQ